MTQRCDTPLEVLRGKWIDNVLDGACVSLSSGIRRVVFVLGNIV